MLYDFSWLWINGIEFIVLLTLIIPHPFAIAFSTIRYCNNSCITSETSAAITDSTSVSVWPALKRLKLRCKKLQLSDVNGDESVHIC